MSRRFFQIRLSQLLLLFVLVSLLIGLCASYVHRTYRDFASDRADRQYKQAQKELEQAVRDNDVALAKRALSAGFTSQLIVGRDPLLHVCVKNGQVDLVELLLEAGADVNQIKRMPNRITTSRPPKLHFFFLDGPPLFAAVGSEQPAKVRREMIRLLKEHGADLLKKIGPDNAMDVAVRAGDADAADLLREYGLPYGVREMATFNRLDELKQVVAEQPDVLKQRHKPIYAARPGHGPTLLGIALRHGHREMSQYLIDAGAPLDALEYFGESLLHMAARGGDPELIRALIARGLDVNARADHGNAPLHLAASGGHLAAAEMLLDAGADIHARGEMQRTALYLAAWSDHPQLLKPLLVAGADATETCHELRADAGRPNLATWQKDTATEMARRIEEMSRELK